MARTLSSGVAVRYGARSVAATGRDERGVVYLEFLLAFMPVFVLFLAVCQLSLLYTGALVVRHAAYAAARSAIVVLEDDPARYEQVPRGMLTTEPPAPGTGPASLLATLGLATGANPAALAQQAISSVEQAAAGSSNDHDFPPQQGARMVTIRTAAYLSLITLAPKAPPAGSRNDTLRASISQDFFADLGLGPRVHGRRGRRHAARRRHRGAGGGAHPARRPRHRESHVPLHLQGSHRSRAHLPHARLPFARG